MPMRKKTVEEKILDNIRRGWELERYEAERELAAADARACGEYDEPELTIIKIGGSDE